MFLFGKMSLILGSLMEVCFTLGLICVDSSTCTVILVSRQVPNVKWEDVGGLEDVKKAILDTVQVSMSVLCFTTL